jgi:Na+-translocating ferredoxin:NAD+ oxidoreductase subunit E
MLFRQQLSRGLFAENPIFRLALGLCPTLAVTNSLANGLGMSAATAFVLLGSNTVIALLRSCIPVRVRIPAFIVIISTFVTISDLLLAAYVPVVHEGLGIFIPLIVVNCIIMGRAEACASKSPMRIAIADALGMGAGFTLALVCISGIREVLGSGTLLGMPVMCAGYHPALIMVLPPGAFLTVGLLMALINYMSQERPR